MSDTELTMNDLALALVSIQINLSFWDKMRPKSSLRLKEMEKLVALNKKLTAILDQFSCPADEEGERPDNGDDIVRLIWISLELPK